MNRSSLNRALMTSAIFLGVWPMASAVNSFRLDAEFVEPASNVTLTFNLDNDQEFYGFQADFHFPEGMEVDLVNNGKADVKLSSRADNSYTVVSNLISTGELRLGAFSATHTPFSGEEGALVCINVSTSEYFKGGQLSVTDILFSDADNKDVKLPDYKVTLRNASDNKFTIPAITFNTGERGTVEAILKNEVPFTAFQFDLYLPEELKVEDNSWSLTSRATESHTLSVRSNENGVTRFLCFSPDSAPILGEDGAVLKFNLEAQGDIIAETFTMKLRNLVFSAPDGREYLLGDSDTEVSVSRAGIVESIVIEPTSWSAMEGDTLSLTAKVYPEDALDKSLTWTSDNEAVATVDATGLVTAVKSGSCTITATANDGSRSYGSCRITVTNPFSGGVEADIYYNGLYYNITSSEDKTVSVVQAVRNPSGIVVIPEIIEYEGITYTVTSIPYQAFYENRWLKHVTIPETIVSIGDLAFFRCNLTELIFNAINCITCGSSEYIAFGCPISSLIIGDKVSRIPDGAFEDCESFTTVIIPNSVKYIGERAFRFSSLSSIILPNSIKSIPKLCFDDCTNLKSIIIPEGVTSIGERSFEECISLESISFPETLEIINSQAFNDCPSLQELSLPANLKKIHCESFIDNYDTYNVKVLYCYAITPPTFFGNRDYFSQSPSIYNATLYVPEESIELYKASNGWRRFKKIEPISSGEPVDPDDPDDPDDKTSVTLTVINPEYGAIEYQYPSGYEAKFKVKPGSYWEVESVLFNDDIITPDAEGYYSTGKLSEDSILEIVYSKLMTGTEEVGDTSNDVKISCRDGEVRIERLPENELVTIYSDTGKLLYSGYSDRIPIDRSLGVVVVRTGSKAYKLCVR